MGWWFSRDAHQVVYKAKGEKEGRRGPTRNNLLQSLVLLLSQAMVVSSLTSTTCMCGSRTKADGPSSTHSLQKRQAQRKKKKAKKKLAVPHKTIYFFWPFPRRGPGWLACPSRSAVQAGQWSFVHQMRLQNCQLAGRPVTAQYSVDQPLFLQILTPCPCQCQCPGQSMSMAQFLLVRSIIFL